MKKMYDFETMGIQAPNCNCPRIAISNSDREALELMKVSCVRKDSRFEIGLPWKTNPMNLPDNYPLAVKRLESLEKSLLKSPLKAEMYKSVMDDYVRNEWACKVKKDEMSIKPVHYLPHHGVYRPEKKSTPLRVVFDPAAPFKGTSLNSLLHKGPGLIGDLYGVLLRFREHPIAFAGDISKMYLQVCLLNEDTHVHRYLWRDLDTSKDPTVYRLLRVTFGVKPSPDMASYVILNIADGYRDTEPDVSSILERDRYMDDILHSCSSRESAIKRMDGLERVLSSGSFKIKEWFTFPPSLSCSPGKVFPPEQHCQETLEIESGSPNKFEVDLDSQEIKTLGVVWNSETDHLKFAIKKLCPQKFTKRQILSVMSSLYDPLGLASCVTVRARIAMQDIWRNKDIGWDHKLPEELKMVWADIFQDMENLKQVTFPRCLKPEKTVGKSHLHVFCDASKSAYGAVAYLVCITKTGPSSRLVSAKARVAPLHHTTIPRLELMAALVGSRLARTVNDEFKEKPSSITLWTDSQIVLHWLRAESINMKPFVGVRVAEIQSTWGSQHWKFVPTALNPADDISRGISSKEVHNRWMEGPNFLSEPPKSWPVEPLHFVPDNTELKKVKRVCVLQEKPSHLNAENYSSWQRLLRVTAFCLRFVNNVTKPLQDRLMGSLSSTEIEKAKVVWIKIAQRNLEDWKSKFSDFNPFSKDEIVRVGGRLKKSNLSYDQVHPIILPANHHISKLIMRDVHEKSYHGGVERTVCDSRREFWIVRGRQLAKSIIRKCVVCRKLKEPPATTLMADLPSDRFRPFEPVFSVTGVDLFGPFFLRYGRNKKIKAWGAIFTCASSRAIHLEIVNDLSTEAFLQSLRRFSAHHGWPHTMISDNGTSFVGTRKELRKLVAEGKGQIEDLASLHNIKWKFITPLSPHQGGFYESLIKQVKRGIEIAVGQQTLRWGEMATVLAEVENLVNSRPLGYMANNPNDLQPLTPNHFLLGRASIITPQGPYQMTKNPRKRFDFVQALVHKFWERFIREYLPTLIKRSKWKRLGRQLKVNDVVLLMDPNIARGNWKLARVIEVYPGSDGKVRNIKVKTPTGEYKRSVQRCCPILEQD